MTDRNLSVPSARLAAVGLLFAATLAACSSGGDAPAAAPAPTPVATIPGTSIPADVATNSGAAFTFVLVTASVSPETDEPIELADASLAASDTDEPDASV